MKTSRQEKIIQIINEYVIDTQEALADKLKEAGFNVTQATVSRDINELGLKKAPVNGKSRYVYSELKQVGRDKFMRILTDAVSGADIAGNLVVIKTVSGMAMAAAAALDSMEFPENVGTIAGDDTIMCAARSEDDAARLMERLSQLIDKNNISFSDITVSKK